MIHQIRSITVVLHFVPVGLRVLVSENFGNRVGENEGVIEVMVTFNDLNFGTFFCNQQISGIVKSIFVLILGNVKNVDRFFNDHVFRYFQEKSLLAVCRV